MKPDMPAMRFVGKLCTAVLYDWAATLKWLRAVVIRFSVPFQLGLEVEKILVGLQIGVPLADDQQSREGVAELTLCLLEFLELGGVVGRLARIDLHLAHAGARFRYFGQGRFFEIRFAGNRLHEIGDEVGAPLILIFDLGPRGIDALPPADELVVTVGPHRAADHDDKNDSDDKENGAADEIFAHNVGLVDVDSDPNPGGCN